MNQIDKLLALDAKCRNMGSNPIKDDLFLLHDLSESSTWDYSLPTLIKDHESYYDKKRVIRNIGDFTKTFYQQYPYLNHIDMSNLFVAGGCVRSFMLGQKVNDIDIFMHGITDVNVAKARIEKFVIDLYYHIKNLKDGSYIKEELAQLNLKLSKVTDQAFKNSLNAEFNKNFESLYQPKMYTRNDTIDIYSNGHTITIYIGGTKLQIILRLYNTPSEILHGFDLGSSAVGFDGTNVYLTSLKRFQFKMGHLILISI